MQKLSLTVLWIFLVTSLGCNMVQSSQLIQTERVAMLLEEVNSKNLRAVHFGKIAEAEGVKLYSLGTETERLFRSRSGKDDRRSSRNSQVLPNDFGAELKTMVHSVREVYSGLLTYDMHYSVLTAGGFYKQGSEHLWEDIDLDVVGISAYFPLVDAPPLRVMTIEELEECWEHIFQEFMYPLQDRNPGRPILFLEFGYVDSAASPHNPSSEEFAPRSFSDTDENGVDDGEETQANIYQAFFNVMDRHSGVVRGAFLWDTMMASDESYARSFAQMMVYGRWL